MAVVCNLCGTRLKKNSCFCHKCGNKVELPIETFVEDPQKSTWGVGRIIGLVFSIVLILIPAVVITYLLITKGAEFGKFDYDSLFPDFNGVMSGRKTAFQLLLKDITVNSAIAAGAVALPAIIIFAVRCSIKKREDGPSLFFFGLFGPVAYLCLSPLLFLFDFGGTYRIIALVLFYLLAALCLVQAIFLSKQLGIDLLFHSIAVMLVGNLFGVLIAPFIGWALLFFGEIFWIIILLALAAGGGGAGAVVVFL